MKMYACRKVGRGYDIAKSTEFKGVNFLDKVNTAINMTKEVRKVFELAGYPIEKSNIISGSMWLYNKNIPPIRDKFKALENSSGAVGAYAHAIATFMTICIDRGYDIRFYL